MIGLIAAVIGTLLVVALVIVVVAATFLYLLVDEPGDMDDSERL